MNSSLPGAPGHLPPGHRHRRGPGPAHGRRQPGGRCLSAVPINTGWNRGVCGGGGGGATKAVAVARGSASDTGRLPTRRRPVAGSVGVCSQKTEARNVSMGSGHRLSEIRVARRCRTSQSGQVRAG
jgi:hypothetical protein